jgi:phage tail-like protein
MARAMNTDPFHNMRYHVSASKSGNVDPFGPATAGFSAVTFPTQTEEVVEYKEGIMSLRRKFIGETTFDDVTLSRGVSVSTSEFYHWLLAARTGNEYRTDIEIKHFHRDNITNQDNFSTLTPSRIVKCFECVPVSFKPGSDLESTSSEVSIQEVTFALERFEVTNSK